MFALTRVKVPDADGRRRNIILDAAGLAAYHYFYATLPSSCIRPMTRRSSQRALAQEIYRRVVEERAASASNAPSLTLPRERGRELAVLGGGENSLTAQNLTERVRALYEHSAVPVAEIARLAGVTERTIYKYAAKGRWTPRYRRSAAAHASVAPDSVPVRGAGGRFIRRAEAGKPFARGLKATDPAGAARADAACAEAACLARAAADKARTQTLWQARLRAIDAANGALHAFNAYAAERRQAKRPARGDDRLARVLWRAVDVAIGRWEWLLGEDERAASRA
jgi:hypothetical protein